MNRVSIKSIKYSYVCIFFSFCASDVNLNRRDFSVGIRMKSVCLEMVKEPSKAQPVGVVNVWHTAWLISPLNT